MKNQLADLYLSLRDFIEPLRRRFESPEALEYLFHRYGWIVSLDQTAFGQIVQLSRLHAPLDAFLQAVDSLRARLDATPGSSPGAEEIAALIPHAESLIAALAEFKLSAFTGLPEPLNRPEFWQSIGEHLLDDLLEEYLRIHHPGFYLPLRLWRIVRFDPVNPSEPFRRPYTRISFDWDQAGAVVRNPLLALKQAYHWNDPAQPLDHQAALDSLAHALHAARIPAKRIAPAIEARQPFPPDPARAVVETVSALRAVLLQATSHLNSTFYKIGFEVFPAIQAGGTVPSGFLIKPILQGGAGVTLPLGRLFTLRWAVAAGAGNAIGFALFPDSADFIGGQIAIGTRLELAPANPEPWRLFGSSRSARIEVSHFSAAVSLEGSLEDPELKLRLGGTGPTGPAAAKVIVPLDEADDFVKETLDKPSLEFAFCPEVIWSSKTGLTFNGRPTLDADLPVAIPLGPVTLTNASIALVENRTDTSRSGFEFRVGLGLHGAIGPVGILIEKIGFACAITPRTRQDLLESRPGEDPPALGALGIDLRFSPPKGIGLAVESELITGGGYLECVPERGEYIGAAQFTLKNRITVKAAGIILTKPQVSFLLLITTDFPPVQLGLGFQLAGVGGLIGIHRRLDQEQLLAGLRDNRLDEVLFPEDPLKNPRGLVNQLAALFPPDRGRHVFGPMALITWGPKNLITIQLGLILEVPFRFQVTIVGVLKAEVTKRIAGKEISVVKLQVNFAGLFDFEQGFVRFDASLYKSTLLGLNLDGELALRLRYGRDPDFVLTLGGFHPDFQPPALGLPANLRRLQMTLRSGNPEIWVDAYLAITPNTVQFGAAGHLRFKKWGVGISGDLGFDALFQFNPFRFEAGVYFLLSASWKGHDFASIEINGKFSGPSPWRIQGEFKLKICWFLKITVSIDESWGDKDETQLGRIDILPLLVEDLRAPSSWEPIPGAGRQFVSCRRSRASDGGLLLHPDDLLSVRQNTVPLNLRVDKFGEKRPKGPSKFSIRLLKAGQPLEAAPLRAHFAPAQFFNRSEEEKLAGKSYELFEAGAGFNGLDAPVFDSWASQDVAYESAYVDDPALEPPEPAPPKPEPLENFRLALLNSSIANSRIGRTAKPGQRTAPPPITEKFAVVNQANLAVHEQLVAQSETEAREMLRSLIRSDPSKRAQLTVLPLFETAQ